MCYSNFKLAEETNPILIEYWLQVKVFVSSIELKEKKIHDAFLEAAKNCPPEDLIGLDKIRKESLKELGKQTFEFKHTASTKFHKQK